LLKKRLSVLRRVLLRVQMLVLGRLRFEEGADE
jgi:hypothetical protein